MKKKPTSKPKTVKPRKKVVSKALSKPAAVAPGSHLLPKAKAALSLPAQERIDYINERLKKWITYPKAEELLERFKKLSGMPRRPRMPCLLVVATTDNGKTTVADRFIKLHASDDAPRANAVTVPVLKIQAPPKSNANWFLHTILRKTFTPFNSTAGLPELMHQVVEVLPRLGLRLLIVDEIQHVLTGKRDQREAMLNTIKYLTNELELPIVALGVEEGLNAFTTDTQLSSRFMPTALPNWKAGPALTELLDSLEASIPLANRSFLGDEPLASIILDMGESTIGGMSRLIVEAAVDAVSRGEESITEEVLRRINWVPPSIAREATMESLGAA